MVNEITYSGGPYIPDGLAYITKEFMYVIPEWNYIPDGL